MNANFANALARAKRQVIRSGRPNVFAYVCRERGEWGGQEFVVYSGAEYEEIGREEDCLAAVWSYEEENGEIAAAVEDEWQ